MKRNDLIKYLKKHNCKKVREGGKHTVFANFNASKTSTVPRHKEINNFLAKKICKDLDIPSCQ